jgi:hypothetical protein
LFCADAAANAPKLNDSNVARWSGVTLRRGVAAAAPRVPQAK